MGYKSDKCLQLHDPSSNTFICFLFNFLPPHPYLYFLTSPLLFFPIFLFIILFSPLSALSSSWEIRKFPLETLAFSEQYSWVFFFLLDNFWPTFTWFFRRTCTGLCVHFLYISSILGELVLVFLWESEKYILAEFWFRPVLTETVTWERERGQTTTAKLVRPYRFSVLRLNWPVCTIYRFLSYFRFFAITRPN